MKRSEVVAFTVLRQIARRDRLSRHLNRFLAPFNPFDPRRYSDPYPLYEELRAAGPVYHHRRTQNWFITGYEETETLLRGPTSADRRSFIEAISPYRQMRPANVELILSSLLMQDPPSHTRLRKLVNRAFTPRAIAALEPRIEALAAELTDDLVEGATGGGTVEVMEAVAARLPIYAIGELLGIDTSRRDELKALSDVTAQVIDPITSFDPAEMDRAVDRFRSMFDELAEERRAEPRNDVVSALVSAEEEGDRLTREELISMIVLLLIAGHETTANLIGNAVVLLGDRPEARRFLLEHPELIENAVEEILRFESPVQGTDRVTLDDVTVGGHTIPAGSTVIVLFGAANRDPRRYDAPNELRLDRPDPHPLSFGHGIHHCLGAALARLEGRVAIPTLLRAVPDYQVEDVVWKRSITLRGPSSLTISLPAPTADDRLPTGSATGARPTPSQGPPGPPGPEPG